jgi:hypothetical protein
MDLSGNPSRLEAPEPSTILSSNGYLKSQEVSRDRQTKKKKKMLISNSCVHGPYARDPISHPNPIFSAMKKQSIVPPLSKTGLDLSSILHYKENAKACRIHADTFRAFAPLGSSMQQQQKFFVILHHIATLHIQVIDRSRLAQALHTLPQFLQLHWYDHLL